MNEQAFMRWVELPEAQPVRFGDLPGLIAGALQDGEFAQAAAEISLEKELTELVDAGKLMVRDPLTLGRHSFPIGETLRRAVLLPNEDLRPLLASRAIGLRLIPYGTGPTHWTIENAARAIAAQEGWHQGACDTLRGQMVQAATEGALTVRHPHTDAAYRPDRVWDFYELVTRDDVNAWLGSIGAPYRWLRDDMARGGKPEPGALDAETRQANRLQVYRDAGFTPPRGDGRWQGVSKVAQKLGIRRQTLTVDLKAALAREQDARRAGAALRM